MNWLLIIIIVLAFIAVLQIAHLKHKVLVVLVFILIAAFYLTFTFAISDHDVDLKNPSGLVQASKIYFSWFGQAASNLQAITGQAVQMDWAPDAPEQKKDPDVMTG